ncbi:hypothetical protein K450DRAFT_274906 [Umbelopsis ramanniana AG]|uniref:Sister chromatid cohesion protein n=1 Tax=Umbelopsis ramanniana AG TaxID=1314678 RepID=A0AAD5HAY4_UMBRA|nr:uncharacterized protein K450DRAFT_274906 [Umbelopsis ramanniana AG]KAI8576239.1 hypothetical protein K450DRAFT_274906 [Umbelopsis ramanniana AG]
MPTRSSNAHDPATNVLEKIRKALQHTALSTVIAPSYATSCIPPLTIEREEAEKQFDTKKYDEIKSFLFNGYHGSTQLSSSQHRLLELRSKIEGKEISAFLQQTDVMSSKKQKTSSSSQRKNLFADRNLDVTEAEDGSDNVIEIKQPNGFKKLIHSDLQMEERSYDDINAAGPSEADVEMADIDAEDQEEPAKLIDDVPDPCPSPSAIVSNRPDDTPTFSKELDEDISAQDDSKMDCVMISEECVHTQEIPNDDTNTAATPVDKDMSSLNNNNEFISINAKETLHSEKNLSLEDHTSQQQKNEVSEAKSLVALETEEADPTQPPAGSHYKPISPPASSVPAENSFTTHEIVEVDTIANTLNEDSTETMKDSFPKAPTTMAMMDESNNEGLEESHTDHTTSNEVDQIIISEHDVITWKDQGQDALNYLNDFISFLQRKENELMQDLHPDIAISLSDTNSSFGDIAYFIREGDQLLLSVAATRKISTLVRRANKHNQLPNVEGEDLGWILKKLEKNVRIGWTSLQAENHSSQEQVHYRHMDDLDIPSLEHAINCTLSVFSILTSTKLDKKLYAEEVITSCLVLTKALLTDIVSPAYDSWNNVDNDFAGTASNEHCESHDHHRQMVAKFSLHLSAIYRQIYRFIQQEDLSEDMIITISYISIPPFFFDTESTIESRMSLLQAETEDNFIDAIKVSAMDVLHSVFSKYPRHRNWILDEILANIIHVSTDGEFKNRYRTASGKSIHAISALLLQTVQCCTDTDRSNERSWTQKWELKHQKSNDKSAKLEESFINKVLATSTSGIEACIHICHTLLQQLLDKSVKKPSEDQSSVEYRKILDMIIMDSLKVLDEPEWPAAEAIARVFSTILINYIDAGTKDVQKRNIALEYLGVLAGHVYSHATAEDDVYEHFPTNRSETDFPLLDDEINTSHIKPDRSLEIAQYHKMIIDYLESRVETDTISTMAIHYYFCQWGYAFASLWKKMNKKLDENDADHSQGRGETQSMVYQHTKFIWDLLLEERRTGTVLEKSLHDIQDIKAAVNTLLLERPLYQSYQAMLSRIFSSLDIESVSSRAVALRALINLSSKNVSFMEKQQVKMAIIRRMQDISPSVRDAAIQLAGNYLASHPEGTQKYLTAISERIMDTSISVRKRVMRILKNVYVNTSDVMIWVDIGTRIIERVADEITAVRDTAVKISMETVFRPWASSYTRHHKNGYAEFEYLPPDFKQEIIQRCNILLQIFSSLDKVGCSSSVETLLLLIIENLDDKNRVNINNMFKLIIDCLFSELLLLEDAGDNTSITNCIGLIHSFARSSPHLFTQTLMTMLEPYLKSSETSDHRALYHAIKIYDTVLPAMKRPDPMFLADSELTLTKLLIGCPAMVLTAAVSCLSTIAHKLTKNYDKLASIMYNCLGKLRQDKNSVIQLQPITASTRLIRLCLIAGLICQHCNFDANEAMDKSGRLKELCPDGVASETFELLYFFAANRVTGEHINQQVSNQIKLAALQSLGYLYIQYPKYMVTKKSTTMMDEMFASRFLDYKSRVMRVFLDFLIGEEKRIIDRERETNKERKGTDMIQLLGNASEMAELSVSSSLMQRYLERILQTALDPNVLLRNLSFKVITRIIQQGLAHPVICMPTIVALETCPDQTMRDIAFQLHFQLNQRHQTLLYSRNVECVRAAYDYNCRLSEIASTVNGHLGEEFDYEALLQPMYSQIREKRKFRNDFLFGIVNLFDLEAHQESQQSTDIYFYRFIVQNLVGLRFKIVEEPLSVIYAINKILSTTAMNLMSSLNLAIEVDGEDEQRDLQSERSKRRRQRNDTKRQQKDGDMELDGDLSIKYSVIISMLLQAKKVLKQVYNLTEEKCQQYHPEDNNSFKAKAAVSQPPIPTYNNLLLEFPVFDTNENDERTVDTACKYFSKLMMDDTLGAASLEYDEDPISPIQSDQDGPDDIFNNFNTRKLTGKISSK